MSLTYGFFNSLNGDRKYNADQLSAIFNNLITDGVFMNVGETFIVEPVSGMIVTVGSGRAWFNSKWSYNDAKIQITIPQSESVLNRIDTIVLEVNLDNSERKNSIKVIKGTPATNPKPPILLDETPIFQYALCDIYIGKGVLEIFKSNITNRVGTGRTPFVTGILESVKLDTLLQQWEGEFVEWFDRLDPLVQQWEGEFVEWFDRLQTILDDDIAGNLLGVIDTHIEDLTVHNSLDLKLYRKNKDENDIFTVLEWRRLNNTLAIKSTLSGGTSPRYTTRKEVYYDELGTGISTQKSYTLQYDDSDDIVSEV